MASRAAIIQNSFLFMPFLLKKKIYILYGVKLQRSFLARR